MIKKAIKTVIAAVLLIAATSFSVKENETELILIAYKKGYSDGVHCVLKLAYENDLSPETIEKRFKADSLEFLMTLIKDYE